MNEKAIEVLEFPQVRERLAHYTAFSASRERALALAPQVARPVVQSALQETSEARQVLASQPTFGVRGAADVRGIAQEAQRGQSLDPTQLLAVLGTLQSAQRLQRALSHARETAPLLARRAATIEPCPAVQQAIQESIAENGDILDSASPALGRVRAQVRIAHSRLVDACNRVVVGPLSALLQEPIVTMRGGRYVVPVKQEHRNTFRGIIHDQSASGATVFMEPLGLVDQNNQWRHLQIAEQQEIECILAELADLVGQHHDQIVAAVETLAGIDLAIAKAHYANALRAVCPTLATTHRLNLIEARHPLLTGEVVPISVALGGTGPQRAADECSVLVITGPNTGGKTVALKTIGLLCIMAQAGLHLPAAEGSTVPVWEDLFADIGDEQSIAQSLSTFSSHMTTIVRVLRSATARCLVLLDEIGVGTDPQEGSALARAVLSDLAARQICTVATTHYSELKAYAATTPGVQNASVEFDTESLAPMYRLHIGLPGQSYALAIAERLGLTGHVLAAARRLVSPNAAQLEELLATIQAERRAASEDQAAAAGEREQMAQDQAELEQRLARIEDERERVLAAGRDEAQGILDDARRLLRRARAAAPGGSAPEASAVARQIAASRRNLRARPRRHGAAEWPDETALAVGDRVRVRRLNMVGQVAIAPSERGEVEVQLGTLRTRVPVADVTPVAGAAAAQRHHRPPMPAAFSGSDEPSVRAPPVPTVGVELDVRGQRVEEALAAVEKYLDDASRGAMPFVRIIHGKGTGALRQALREWLATYPLATSFEPADAHSGGDGATVVQL